MLINRNRADGDPSFRVSVEGFSRVRWNLVLQVLEKFRADETNMKNDLETYWAVEGITRALKSHIIENSDGYTLGGQQYREPTELEKECLQSATVRHAEEKRQAEEFARSLGFEPVVEHNLPPWLTGEKRRKASRAGR